MAGIQLVSFIVIIAPGVAANLYPSQRQICQSSGRLVFAHRHRRLRSSTNAYAKRTLGECILVFWYPKEYPKSRSLRQETGWAVTACQGILYRNGFLGEANDAGNLLIGISIPFLLYTMTKIIRKRTLDLAIVSSFMMKVSYGTTACFGVLAGFEYRRFDLEQRTPGRTHDNEDARNEKEACVFSAIGAAGGIPFAWALRQPKQALDPNIQFPRASLSQRLAFGISNACYFAYGLNHMNRSWKKIDIYGHQPSQAEGNSHQEIIDIDMI